MDPVEEIVSKLQRYPAVAYRLLSDGGGIDIDAPNPGGFSVSLINDDPYWTVHAGDYGGHWHLTDPEEALNLVDFCLSEDCRLKVEERTFQIRSTLEERNEEDWRMVWQREIFVIRLWKPRTTKFFHNNVIPTRPKADGG